MADEGMGEATTSPAPSLRERRRAWFAERARLKVTVDPWPASAPPTNFSYHSGQRRTVIKVTLAVALVASIAAIFIAPPLIAFVVIIAFNVVMRALPDEGIWTDRCIAPAVARAAQDLGIQTGPREWRVTGAPAVELATEVVTLRDLPSPTRPDGAYPTAVDRERADIAAAGPILRRYLRPVLTASEHGNEPLVIADDAPSLAPGDPWPLLNSGAPQWGQPERRSTRS
ncbi:MAG: hypothetical protein LWW77_05450 [Propionibacteriales bacterium]|nr:hypothetical protein [Propionibacteriales bacterium]